MKLKNRFRIYTIYVIHYILHIFYLFPLDKKKIIFSSYRGEKITCNPYYVYLKFIEKHPNHNVYWLSKDNDKSRIREQDKIISPKGLIFFYHLLTASVIVDNDGFKSYIPIRKRQLYINTWHGGGLFKSAYGGTRSKEEIEYSERIKKIKKRSSIKVLISTSEAWTKINARYRFKYNGEILKSGYPRNDIFFKNNDELILKVKAALGIRQDEKIVVFAPTFRGGLLNRLDGECIVDNLDVNQLISSLEKRFGGVFRFVYRGHHASHLVLNVNGVDATDYIDMQELMIIADVFISDYSSCLWDFSLTYKPCLIFGPDFDEYLQNPGFESDYREWPFPIAKSNDELSQKILSFDTEQYKVDVENYLKKYGSYEDGHASERVVRCIENGLEIKD